MAPSDTIAYAMRLEIARSLNSAIAAGLARSNQVLAQFAAGVKIGAKGDMAAVNKAVAADMREAVVDAYERFVEGQQRVPSYQRTSRLSGRLGAAVRKKNLAVGDATGIYFVDEEEMSKEAAHWKRLNFGAGEAAGPQRAGEPLRIFGQTVGDLNLETGPQAPFMLPAGFFGNYELPNAGQRGAGSDQPFYANRKSPYRPAVTAGIRGRHFLEAGVDVAEQQLPKRYNDMLNKWIADGGRKARAINKVVLGSKG